jgi:hypothetical protein
VEGLIKEFEELELDTGDLDDNILFHCTYSGVDRELDIV